MRQSHDTGENSEQEEGCKGQGVRKLGRGVCKRQVGKGKG